MRGETRELLRATASLGWVVSVRHVIEVVSVLVLGEGALQVERRIEVDMISADQGQGVLRRSTVVPTDLDDDGIERWEQRVVAIALRDTPAWDAIELLALAALPDAPAS